MNQDGATQDGATQDGATQDQVQRFYDFEAESYDATRYQSKRGRRRDLFHKEILLRFLEEIPGGGASSAEMRQASPRVLEIGCGTGRLLEAVATAGYDVIGIDLSKGMLEQAGARLKRASLHAVPLLQTNELPFPPATFAAAYSVFVVNLMPDYQQVFANVAAKLQPNGVFVFNIPNLSSVYWPFGTIINWRGRTSTSNASGARYSHWFSRKEWTRALQKVGFQVELVEGEPPWCGRAEVCQPLDGRSPAAWLCKSLFVKARLT